MVQNSKRRRNNAAIWKILLIAKVIAKNDTKSPIFRPLDRFWKFCSVGSSLNTVLLLFWKFHDDSSKNGQDTAYIFSIFNCESEESQNRRKIKRTKRARWITRVILEHTCEYFLWLTNCALSFRILKFSQGHSWVELWKKYGQILTCRILRL